MQDSSTVKPLFRNRTEAGRFLGQQLMHHRGRPGLLVLALPRGGVPVGFEVAHGLEAQFDVFLVRKLGVPGHEEFAFGALASGGVRVVNDETVQHLGITSQVIDSVVAEESAELERRERLYRGGRPPAEIRGREVILVDDGLATGSSMRAAVRALRQRGPATITVAVPVGATDTCDLIRGEVDEVVCGRTPEPFHAVGLWYEDFAQTTDEEVVQMLDHHAHRRKALHVRQRKEAVL